MIPLAFQDTVVAIMLALMLALMLATGIAIGLALAQRPINWTPILERLRDLRESALTSFYGNRLDPYKATRPPGVISTAVGTPREPVDVDTWMDQNARTHRTVGFEYRYLRLSDDGVGEAYKTKRAEGNRYQTERRVRTPWEAMGDPYTFGDDELPEDYSVVAVTGPEHVRPPEAEWQTDETGELVQPVIKSYPPMKHGLPRTPQIEINSTHECSGPRCNDWTHWYGAFRATPVRRDYAGLYDAPGPLHIPEREIPA